MLDWTTCRVVKCQIFYTKQNCQTKCYMQITEMRIYVHTFFLQNILHTKCPSCSLSKNYYVVSQIFDLRHRCLRNIIGSCGRIFLLLKIYMFDGKASVETVCR